ncbi:hypothetical protein [Sphingomonas phyllosphaerae]|uniref:hypothetical protein n=1 Tax=Sphingomonas phyllosphaerae TaxID=257003 RepID=UPI0024137990|nr:hypothetical protein [Sphingomonas phyllosphaerae]
MEIAASDRPTPTNPEQQQSMPGGGSARDAAAGRAGGSAAPPRSCRSPTPFPQKKEDQEHNYDFFVTSLTGSYPEGRFTSGPSIDRRGEFTVFRNEPPGGEPEPGAARPDGMAQVEQTDTTSA